MWKYEYVKKLFLWIQLIRHDFWLLKRHHTIKMESRNIETRIQISLKKKRERI